MLQKLRSNRSVQSVGPMGTWTWIGPIGLGNRDGPSGTDHIAKSVGLGRYRSGPDRGCASLAGDQRGNAREDIIVTDVSNLVYFAPGIPMRMIANPGMGALTWYI